MTEFEARDSHAFLKKFANYAIACFIYVAFFLLGIELRQALYDALDVNINNSWFEIRMNFREFLGELLFL